MPRKLWPHRSIAQFLFFGASASFSMLPPFDFCAFLLVFSCRGQGKRKTRTWETEREEKPDRAKENYFTSNDPHHDMLGGGCQVRVVIENMMGRMENLKTLISGFLGLVILVRWALVTMFLS